MNESKVKITQMPLIHPKTPFMYLVQQEGMARVYIGGTAESFEVWFNKGEEEFIKTRFEYSHVVQWYSAFKNHAAPEKAITPTYFASPVNNDGFYLEAARGANWSILNHVRLRQAVGESHVLVAGKLGSIQAFFDILEIILMIPAFMRTFGTLQENRLDLYEEHFGAIEDYQCEYCHNFTEPTGECLWCNGKCTVCGFAPVTECECPKCGHEVEEC